MSGTCWFCTKNLGASEYTVRIPLIKLLDSQRTEDWSQATAIRNVGQVTTTYKYLQDELSIPRCETCAGAHNNMRLLNLLWIGFPILSALLGSLLFIITPSSSQNSEFFGYVCACAWFASFVILLAGFVAKTEYLRRKGIQPLAEKRKHPDLLARQKDGWTVARK